MDDDPPPPVPPKIRKNGQITLLYTEEDISKALKEEELELERIRLNKIERSQSQRSRKDVIPKERPRAQTPTDRTESSRGSFVPPIPKPRANSLVQSRELISHSITNSTLNQLDNSRSSNISNKTSAEKDLMSFHSPEKVKNEDVLDMIHKLNTSRTAVVPINSNQNFINNFQRNDNQFLTSNRSVSLNFSPFFSQNVKSSPPLNWTSTPVNSNIFTNNLNSTVALSNNIPQPLPRRSPVMGFHRMSALVNQLSVTNQSPHHSNKLSISSENPEISKSSQSSALKSGRKKYGDLIDLSNFNDIKFTPQSSTSILDDFDPLSSNYNSSFDKLRISSEASEMLKYKSPLHIQTCDDEKSYYEQQDPFEYMYGGTNSSRSDPVNDIYDGLLSPGAVGGETFDVPPPLPPRQGVHDSSQVPVRKSKNYSESLKKHISRADSVDQEDIPKKSQDYKSKKRSCQVYDGKVSSGYIQIQKTSCLRADEEAMAFWEQVKKLRAGYTWSDHIGNPGLLHSPCLENNVDQDLSIKLIIHYSERTPIVFTCTLNTSVEHIVMQTLVLLELQSECSDFLLKVRGVDEFLIGESILGEYDYVHGCIKHDLDIKFTLVHADNIKKSYQRTAEDDNHMETVEVGDLMTAGSGEVVHFDKLSIALETFERELNKLQTSGFLLIEGTYLEDLPSTMTSNRLRQGVKQICALLGELETVEICESITFLVDTCRLIQKAQGILDGEDDIPGQQVVFSTGSHDSSLSPENQKQVLLDSLSRLASAVNNFLIMYSKAFRVDFTVQNSIDPSPEIIEISSIREKLSVKICGIHRLSSEWKYDEYFVEAQLYHGSRCIGQKVHSTSVKVDDTIRFYPKALINEWLDLKYYITSLPKESRLVLTVFGVKRVDTEKTDVPQYTRDELGWCAVQYFSFDGYLTVGPRLLTLWDMLSDPRLAPAPHSADHLHAHSCPVLSIELKDFGQCVKFPDVKPLPPNKLNFSDLDQNTQQLLRDNIEMDIFTFTKRSSEDREILWEKRHYLHNEPAALAKVLLAAHSDFNILPNLHSMVLNWATPIPSDALHLLLPSFADTVVRTKAVEWLRGLGSDELISFLPQLVQAVKHESWDVSATAELLLERALTSPRLAHHLYWLLNQCLPLQASMSGEREVMTDARYKRRLNLVTRALMIICGSNMENRLLMQQMTLRSLYHTAMTIKNQKDSLRHHTLYKEMTTIHENLMSCPTSLPLSPSLEVQGVDIKSCSYYMSNTVPLKLAFLSSEENTDNIHTIFKVGDDLRQDMLVIQMIRLMDKLWLKAGLDLKIVTFNVVPTGDRIGIIELVKDAETLRKIQSESGGVTGSFQDRTIADWLAKQNPTQLEYQRAVDNFTASCAGYCVATYILGICDRHNDNIMLKTSGHLFHIDFGKFLGDAQKFGNFKRDRTPFVLTSDMAYVINGGDKATNKFQSFVDLCCTAFNIVRKNGHLLLYLFALMASSGIPGVTYDAVSYVQRALLPEHTNAEAGAFFARMIQESLKSWFTQVNFFIHNLAQMRFSGDGDHSSEEQLLSFIPKTYTKAQDGRIKSVKLFSYQKRYNPNKYYVYILKVLREEQKAPTYLFRSYKEFSEFHQKLCCIYPLASINSLPRGVQFGRSEVKTVAERRKFDISVFITSLFDLSDEIAHSDLVYTFFHPLLRDQEDADIESKKLKNKDSLKIQRQPSSNFGYVQGQVKVSLQYSRGQLLIIVQYARNLSLQDGTKPSPYVKLYLLPDPNKKTKRKTKICKDCDCPTFMEEITYRMSEDTVQRRVLEVSVWSEDKFSENTYLGSSYLKLADQNLKEEMCEWLTLENRESTAREHMMIRS